MKGTIYITSDINLCLANLNTCKNIIVSDEPEKYNIPDQIGGSLLLPPYEAMAAMVDDDDERFRLEYFKYLSSNIVVNKFIDIVLQALIAGTNMILYIDPEGPNFTMTLKEYFLLTFGINIGDANVEYGYRPEFVPVIYNRLYLDDAIDNKYFLQLYPNNINFDSLVLRKLAYEYGLQFVNDISADVYFKKQATILKNGGLVKGVITRL